MSSTITSDLLKAKIVTDNEVNAAVDVFMTDLTTRLFRFKSGHCLDLADAVRAHQPGQGAVAHPNRPREVPAQHGADGDPAGAADGTVSDDPCHDAAEVLRAMGWDVQDTGDDRSLWLVDGEQLGDADLMALARLVGLVTAPETIQ